MCKLKQGPKPKQDTQATETLPLTQVLQEGVALAGAAEGGVHAEGCQLRQLLPRGVLAQRLHSSAAQHLRGVVKQELSGGCRD